MATGNGRSETALRVVVVDDEPVALEYLKLILQRIGGVEIAAACKDAAECIREVARTEPDAVFLDIHLPDNSGMDAATALKGLGNPPGIVFVTGYDDYAIPAFEVAALDYVMKPYSQERLAETVDRLRAARAAGRNGDGDSHADIGKLAVKNRDGYKLIDPGTICFVRIENRRPCIRTKTDSLYCYTPISDIAQKLKGYRFFRANEQCLVNLDCVEEVVYYGPGSYELQLSEPEETFIPLSRSRTRQLREILDF